MMYKITDRFILWLCNWIDLIDSLSYILTFTLYSPYWALKARYWHVKWRIHTRKKRAERYQTSTATPPIKK